MEVPNDMDRRRWTRSVQAAARPALQARATEAFAHGLQQRSDVELRLGEYVGQFAELKRRT